MNDLTPGQAELLALLAEECGECVQAIGKILRHGYASRNPLVSGGVSNLDALAMEMGDVRCAMRLLCEAGPVREDEVARNADLKAVRVGRWLHYQGVGGVVSDVESAVQLVSDNCEAEDQPVLIDLDRLGTANDYPVTGMG